MANDDRDLLTVLKVELQFLEDGGYRHCPNAPWRPQFIFEDSSTCINHERRDHLSPCRECILMHFVPADCRDETIPCRHIPLNDAGYTLDTYYRLGTFEEAEAVVRTWLRKKIHELETETPVEKLV